MQLKILAASAALLAMVVQGSIAHAQVDVIDRVTNQHTSDTADNTGRAADKLDQTYTMFTTQQSGVSTQFNGQDTGTGLNPMPDSQKVASQLSYTNPQTPAGTADTIYKNNNIDEKGTDPEATALTNAVYSASNIQGMAIDNLKALQDRLSELDDMNKALANASSITEIAAINGRIAVEALAVQAQQAQAANLTALATAQAELDITNREQATRQEHQTTALLFPGSGLSLIGAGG